MYAPNALPPAKKNNLVIWRPSKFPAITVKLPHFLFAFTHHACSDFLPAFFLKLAYCFSNLYFGSLSVFSTFLNATLPRFLASCKSVSQKIIVQACLILV